MRNTYREKRECFRCSIFDKNFYIKVSLRNIRHWWSRVCFVCCTFKFLLKLIWTSTNYFHLSKDTINKPRCACLPSRNWWRKLRKSIDSVKSVESVHCYYFNWHHYLIWKDIVLAPQNHLIVNFCCCLNAAHVGSTAKYYVSKGVRLLTEE